MTAINRLGIVSSNRSRGPETYFGEATHFYDEAVFINLEKLSFQFQRGVAAPIVFHDGENISDLSMLYVFGSVNNSSNQRTMLLVRSMIQNGCPVSDSLDRLTRHGMGKLFDTLRSLTTASGIDSFAATSFESLEHLLSVNSEGCFVTKPTFGSGGRDIEKFDSKETLLNHAKEFFRVQAESGKQAPIFVEKFINFSNEWRVYLVDGEFVCSYEKVLPENSFIANLHHGGGVIKSDPEDEAALRNFVCGQAVDDLKRGIYGLDVGRTFNGQFFLIEANRSPGWTKVLQTTGVNFPYETNRILFRRARKWR